MRTLNSNFSDLHTYNRRNDNTDSLHTAYACKILNEVKVIQLEMLTC